MNTTTALFKKELRTAKWFLLGGMLFFWSFPLLDMAGRYYQNDTLRTDMPSGMALVFGAMFAIVTAGGLVCLDMPKGLYEFWRSRPVGLAPYLLVKYSVGLAAVLFVITVPILFEMILFRKTVYNPMASFQGSVLFFHSFVIILIYSIAFYTGHLFRTMNEAIIISCAAALLVYFVPLLVPALERLSFINILNEAPVLSGKSVSLFYVYESFGFFIITAIVLSIVLFCAAWICLKYHLQVQLTMKSMCWCLGVVALVLFSAAAFSVGTNLKCVVKNSLPVDGTGVLINSCFDGKGGLLLYGDFKQDQIYKILQIRQIEEESASTYQQKSYRLIKPLQYQYITYMYRRTAWSSQQPNIVYFLGINETQQGNLAYRQFSLYVITLDDSALTASVQSELILGEYDAKKSVYFRENIKLTEKTVYADLPDGIAVIDISSSLQPQLLTKVAYQNRLGDEQNELTFVLSSDRSLSPRQQQELIQIACHNSDTFCWDDHRYAEYAGISIRVYMTNESKDTQIELKKIAEYHFLPLEKLLYSSPRKMILSGDTIFVLDNGYRLTVYQFNESAGTLKRAGHYAAPEGRFFDMMLRQDGKLTLVGEQIHILQPPETKGH